MVLGRVGEVARQRELRVQGRAGSAARHCNDRLASRDQEKRFEGATSNSLQSTLITRTSWPSPPNPTCGLTYSKAYSWPSGSCARAAASRTTCRFLRQCVRRQLTHKPHRDLIVARDLVMELTYDQLALRELFEARIGLTPDHRLIQPISAAPDKVTSFIGFNTYTQP